MKMSSQMHSTCAAFRRLNVAQGSSLKVLKHLFETSMQQHMETQVLAKSLHVKCSEKALSILPPLLSSNAVTLNDSSLSWVSKMMKMMSFQMFELVDRQEDCPESRRVCFESSLHLALLAYCWQSCVKQHYAELWPTKRNIKQIVFVWLSPG